jgi:lipopolysaccharide biosynthesis regulator YciM
LFLAFRDIQAAFRQLDNDAGWESFLRAFTQRHPGDPTGYLALAEWYEARGQTEDALPPLRQVLELDPTCREAHLALLSLYRRQGLPSEALESYERLAKETPQLPGGRFRCRVCRHAQPEPFWRCPSCRVWATPERLIPPPRALPIATGELAPPLERSPTGASTSMVVT